MGVALLSTTIPLTQNDRPSVLMMVWLMALVGASNGDGILSEGESVHKVRQQPFLVCWKCNLAAA